MINENRVRLMTKMQLFEDHEGEKTRPMAEYLEDDYVDKQLMISVVTGTVGFLLFCILVLSETLEDLLLQFDFSNVWGSLLPYLLCYLGFMAIYLGSTYIVYKHRYVVGRKKIKEYFSELQTLEKMYKEEDRKVSGGEK